MRRSLAMLLGGALCWVAVLARADGGYTDADGWADVLRKESAAGAPLPLLTRFVPDLDLRSAYAIQRALVDAERLERRIGGYKAGFTSRDAQKKFALDGPVSGVLFTDGARLDGARISAPAHAQLMVELEIGFVLRSPIRRAMKSVDDLKTYVAHAQPVLELPLLNFGAGAGFTALDLVATNIGSFVWVAGKPLPFRDAERLNALEVRLLRDGQVIDQGRAGNALGDQWQALLWLVNHLYANGWPLAAGQLLITGTLGQINPGLPGRYEAIYGEAARVAFDIVAAPAASRPE